MMSLNPASAEIVGSVRAWVQEWGAEVAAVDFVAGRDRFHPDAIAFGTRADVVVGRELIAAEQWTRVWPNIADFAFDLDHLRVVTDDVGNLAVAIVPWTSTGFDEDGRPFDRPGRATIVLRRQPLERSLPEWLAVHTHFSLALGVPARSFGQPRQADVDT